MRLHDRTMRLVTEDDESDDELFAGLEAFDDESDDEAAPARPSARSTPFVRARPPSFRASPALGAGRVSSAAGPSAVRFERPVATAQAIEQLKNDVQKAIAEVRQETRTNLGRIDDRLKSTAGQVDKLDKAVRASVNRVGGLEQRSQLFALLPLLQGRPKAEKITINDDPVKGKPLAADISWKEDRSDMLMPLILLGGLGGSPGMGGTGDSNMALLAVALLAK